MSKLLVSTQDFSSLSQIADQLLEGGEEIPESLENALAETLTTQAEVITNYCQYLSHLEREVEAVEKEIELAQNWIESRRKRQQRIENLVAYVMRKTGNRKLEGMHGHKFVLRRSESVQIACKPHDLPGEFVNIEQVQKVTADKKAIKDAIKFGIEVPGCTLEVNDHLSWE